MRRLSSFLMALPAVASKIPPIRSRPTILSPACQIALLRRETRPWTPSAITTRINLFSSTSPQLARKKAPPKKDRRVTLIRYFLNHPTTLTPRPLRLSRTRFLRHWTIHRAWQLHRHKVKAQRQASLQLQYDAMRDACEELRIGAGDGGRLFRKAMMKTGVFGLNAVPIEYSRGMVDYVGTVDGSEQKLRVWDATWTR